MTSIFWLNYNSSSFIDTALKSLQGVKDLNYSNYELIIVDNCSTDGSFNVVKNFINNKMGNVHVKTIRLPRNVGFNGGNNVAYRARNHESTHVVFLNNDAIPYSNSLTELVEFIESDNFLGAVEGTTLFCDGRTIDSAGHYLSEYLTSCSLHGLEPFKPLRGPHYTTYADGAYSVLKVSSIQKAVGRDDLIFDDYMFAYYDDHILGLKMWNAGFKVAAIPAVVAKHKRSASFGKNRPFQVYLDARAWATLNEISNSRYKKLIKTLSINNAYANSTLEILHSIIGHNIGLNAKGWSAALIRGLSEGVRIGRAKRALGETIDIYKAPIIRLNQVNFFTFCLSPWVRPSGRVVRKLNSQISQGL